MRGLKAPIILVHTIVYLGGRRSIVRAVGTDVRLAKALAEATVAASYVLHLMAVAVECQGAGRPPRTAEATLAVRATAVAGLGLCRAQPVRQPRKTTGQGAGSTPQSA